MDLTKKERLLLINQFLILEKLYPEEAKYHEKNRIALQHGFKLHYNWIFENISDELSEDECRDVLDTLELYRALITSFDNLGDKQGLNETDVKFPGFDGNNEPELLAYTRYFIVDLDRYDELIRGRKYPDFNSHAPMMHVYKRRHAFWKSLNRPYNMSASQIREVLEL